MTTEHNKALVRAFVQAVNQKDWRRFDELVAPDFLRHSSTFGQSQIRSRDQLRDYLAGEFKTFPDAHEAINFLVAEGDKVTVHSHCHGTQKGPMGSFPASGTTPASTNGPSTVVIDRVPGSFLSSDAGLRRITGRVKVLNAHKLAFDDGTEIELNGGMDAPELDQKGLIGDALYPCGKEAAEFLRKMIGDQRVTSFVFGNKGNKVRGDCFIQETNLEIEMVRNGVGARSP